MAEPDELAPPSDEFTRQRWINGRTVEWVRRADAILVEHGAVHGRTVYPRHHVARWRARKLIRLMVELRFHERWELREHVERKGNGYVWSVEYLGGGRQQ